MGYQNSFLFRESLNDTGTTPTVDSIYWSPDIICHDMVADPDAFFAENYDRDVSQAVHTGTALNFLYTRVKNLSKDATPAVGYINVYRTHSSLFMQPSLWRNNPIPTASGKRSLAVQSSVPGEIVTGGDFFRLSGLESNTFCMMGIVSDSPTPTLPESDFRTYDDFAYWFRRNPAVCARNLTVYSGTTRQFEGMHSLSNPESEEKEVFIRVRATDNIPAGTVYGIHCSALGIQQEQTVKEGEHNDFVVLTHLPPGIDTWICSYASLPSGTGEWPAGEKIDVGFFVTMEPQHKSYCFGASAASLGMGGLKTRNTTPFQKLVQLGCCSTIFINEKG